MKTKFQSQASFELNYNLRLTQIWVIKKHSMKQFWRRFYKKKNCKGFKNFMHASCRPN